MRPNVVIPLSAVVALTVAWAAHCADQPEGDPNLEQRWAAVQQRAKKMREDLKAGFLQYHIAQEQIATHAKDLRRLRRGGGGRGQALPLLVKVPPHVEARAEADTAYVMEHGVEGLEKFRENAARLRKGLNEMEQRLDRNDAVEDARWERSREGVANKLRHKLALRNLERQAAGGEVSVGPKGAPTGPVGSATLPASGKGKQPVVVSPLEAGVQSPLLSAHLRPPQTAGSSSRTATEQQIDTHAVPSSLGTTHAPHYVPPTSVPLASLAFSKRPPPRVYFPDGAR